MTTTTQPDSEPINYRYRNGMRYISDPRINFGEPTHTEARVTLSVLISAYRAGDSVAEVAYWYGISEAGVRDVLRYYGEEERLTCLL